MRGSIFMWTNYDGEEFDNEEDYLKSLKQDESYSFTYSFEYISRNYGNDKYDIETANMEISVNWSDAELGYVISYSVPDMYRIDPSQGNGNERDFYEDDVKIRLIDDLDSMGIGVEIIATSF